MKGFRAFIMRGNLVELAVAFIMGGAFATVVTTFTAIILALLGKLGGSPDFSNYNPGNVPVGKFLTALIAFLILAFVVYFFVVKPYQALKARFEKPAPAGETVESLLTEIRDELRSKPLQP
ncbi:MAG TPA: large conductance mechanosensitive channel protein MscL [Propionibacteriaceae bacterium]|nr:large conductance mechanosensitive channel protein MscL [Propionibacteriaceae bacterium]HEX2856728.1 large conductance mechanosensitive channel protein MscL [Propionibacteriaceae bacterium]